MAKVNEYTLYGVINTLDDITISFAYRDHHFIKSSWKMSSSYNSECSRYNSFIVPAKEVPYGVNDRRKFYLPHFRVTKLKDNDQEYDVHYYNRPNYLQVNTRALKVRID